MGKFTTMEMDNTVAKHWWDSSRCPRSPFDRCAQGVHLHLLKKVVKIRTEWVSSKTNQLADVSSRRHFSRRAKGHLVGGVRIRKVNPRFYNVMRFL